MAGSLQTDIFRLLTLLLLLTYTLKSPRCLRDVAVESYCWARVNIKLLKVLKRHKRRQFIEVSTNKNAAGEKHSGQFQVLYSSTTK